MISILPAAVDAQELSTQAPSVIAPDTPEPTTDTTPDLVPDLSLKPASTEAPTTADAPTSAADVPFPSFLDTALSPEEQDAFDDLTAGNEDSPRKPVDFGRIGDLRVDRFEARQVFANYMVSEEYPEAIEAAVTGLDLTREELGDNHPETIPYINDLANALLRNDQPGEARIQFEKSVSLLRETSGIFSPELVEPLVGLGLAFQDMDEHEQAIDTFNYAQHVTHREDGVYNLDQVRIIEATASSFAAQEKWLQAENLHLLAYKLYKRNYGVDSEESLPGLYRLARWYQQVQDYRQARVVFRKAMKRIEKEHGDRSPRLIAPLKGIAGAYLEENGPDAIKGLRASEDILAIMNDNPQEFSLEQRILAHLEMGDWFVQFNRSDDAWGQYRAGWELAQTDTEGERDWMVYFDRPHLIYPGARLGLEVIGYGRVGDQVYYDFQFTIARSGRPEEIEIIGTNLHGQTRSVALQAFRFARFRPRIVDGATVSTPGYKVRRVYPTDAPPGYGSAEVGRRG